MILKVGFAAQLQLELSWVLSTIYWCDVYRKLIDIKSVYVGTTNTLAHTSYTECCSAAGCSDTADTEVESN